MPVAPDAKRKQDETVDSYLYRVGSNKDIYNLDWLEIRDLMNESTGNSYNESTWRKRFSSFRDGVEYAKKSFVSDNEVVKEIEDKTLEFQKERFKFQDQKREYTNIVRSQARFEHLKDEIHKSILELAKHKPLKFVPPSPTLSNTKANTLWSDWHVGSEIRNSLNTYSLVIFKERVKQLVSKVIETGRIHNVSELTIADLGDMISGAIHVSTRVQASEDVIRQLQIVAEVIAESVAELSGHFDKIKLITIIGNHSRLIPNKTEALHRENLEYLIPWYLESRLAAFSNVEIVKDTDGYYIDEVDGEKHVYVHGDLDHVASVARTLPQLLGFVPKYVFCGHIHHDTVKEYGRTKVISNGSLMGIDDYALTKRFYAEPMQKMHIFDGPRIKCTYDFELK
ncbi:hypothetical protein [Paenibacillus medicaginis]|uniref:Calcineurin-like phosphoesterase domain-containing protein n=1 Tax=Paenibacillus medicaginis TaxID=1470560 RepID=A0ABV5BVB1_9BACL